jgi:hypothetical protein
MSYPRRLEELSHADTPKNPALLQPKKNLEFDGVSFAQLHFSLHLHLA